MKRRTRVLLVLGALVVAGVLWHRWHGPVARVLAWWPQITGVAREAGVDPCLVAALVHAESGGDPMAAVAGGGTGLLQLTRAAATDAAGGQAVVREALLDPALNLELGARYLALLVARFEALPLALAAWRLGPTRIAREVESAGGARPFLDRFRTHPAWLYVTKVSRLQVLYREQTARLP